MLDVLADSAFTDPLDGRAQIKVQIAKDHEVRAAHIDFTGTPEQSEFNYNVPMAICRAVMFYVFRTLAGSMIPMNEGCMEPLNLIVPEGSMINPGALAAVISNNTEVSHAIEDWLYGALRVIPGSQWTMSFFFRGNDVYQNYARICVGTGGAALKHLSLAFPHDEQPHDRSGSA